jgi:TonB-dependent starch-binding outer membrane protein SusC
MKFLLCLFISSILNASGNIFPDITTPQYWALENDPVVNTPPPETQDEVKGRVVDSDTGNPLPGINIFIQATGMGTVTGPDGYFSIAVPGPETVLQITSIGYIQQMVEIGDQRELYIIMQPGLSSLDEVIMVGYGSQRLASVTGSISQIRGEELRRAPVLNYSNALSGRLPGLLALSRSGEPGNDDAILRIRGEHTLGNNSPLVVIDGITGRDLQRLNPEDIESITVLKDASSAIYGIQAANGVILITTKRGGVFPFEVSITHNQGWGMPTFIPEMADAATYATMMNEIRSYSGPYAVFSYDDIQRFADGSDPWNFPNTDWFSEVYKSAAPQSKTNATLQGGSETFKYFVSLEYNYQDAIYKNSATNYDQAGFRSNFDAKLSKHIILSLDLSGRQTTGNYPTRSASNIQEHILRGKPTMHAYWPNGLAGPDPTVPPHLQSDSYGLEYGNNPVVTTTNQTGRHTITDYIFENKMKLEADIPWVKGLKATGSFSADKTMLNSKLWQTPWHLYTWDGSSYNENNQPVLIQQKRGYATPQLKQDFGDSERITINALLNYTTTIKDVHNLNMLVGTERITGESMGFWAFRRNFDSGAIDQLFAGGDAEKDNSGTGLQHARLSYLGRINYDYLGKYLIEFAFRYDGSSIFRQGDATDFSPEFLLGTAYRMKTSGRTACHLSIILKSDHPGVRQVMTGLNPISI